MVLLFLGLDIKVTNSEGIDRAHDASGYALPGKQLELVKAVAAVGKPVVVVLLAGMAVGIDYIAEQTWPIMVPGYGGIFAPEAIASTIFGDLSPSGKLPYTIYPEAWAANTPMEDMSLTAGDGRTYRWFGYKDDALKPSFALGTGLTYSKFSVDATDLPAAQRSSAAPLARWRVTLTNTGDTPSSEAVLLYVRPLDVPDAPRPLPRRTLFDFARSPILRPGESFGVELGVTLEALSIADWAGVRAAFAGDHEIIFSNGAGVEVTRQVHVPSTTVLDTLPPPPGARGPPAQPASVGVSVGAVHGARVSRSHRDV